MRLKEFIVVIAMLCATIGTAFGHGNERGEKSSEPVIKEQKAWGIAGRRADATRTITVKMADTMRFTPDAVQVRQGETIRFVIRNTGKLLHEFVIGTRAGNDEHAALMLRFPGMEHDEPYMAHVGPGKTGEIVWTFNRPGAFDFACLIAGHYQAGMVGQIVVSARTDPKALDAKAHGNSQVLPSHV